MSHLSEPVVFLNGQFLPKSAALISPDDRGFVYADGVYEVLRFYRGKLFAPELHTARLRRSLAEIFISGVDETMLVHIAGQLIVKNGMEQTDGIIYFQATRGTAPRKHPFPKDAVPTVYATATALERPVDKLQTGVPVLLMEDIRWTRCDIKSISLLPNVMASEQAAAAGCYETLFHREGWITEGSRSNVFFRHRGTWFTHPADRFILNGITRILVLDLMRKHRVPVQETPFSMDELRFAEEAFVCSTTSEIMPINAISGKQLGRGKPGFETRRLQELFEAGLLL